MEKKVKHTFRYRSAINGHYVTEKFALENPDTTVREEIKK